MKRADWPSRLRAFKALAALMAAMIAVHIVNAFVLGHAWDRYGIEPRGAHGFWPGVMTAPFLHVSNVHLVNNLIVLAVLGGMVALAAGNARFLAATAFIVLAGGMAALVAGNKRFLAATAFIVLAGGALTWLIARSGSHIGASGLVFGYFGFLVGQGLFRQSLLTLVVAGAVTFFYGANIFFGIVFPQGCTSWEAHLAGALAGLAYARLELLAGRR